MGTAPGLSFGHESIEDALRDAFPLPERRRQIYFGNWLRDHSQAIDPALIRPANSRNILEGFTRGALTRVLDVMARGEFGNLDTFRVTPKMLGVYRAEEHIDNPHGIEDHSRDDKDFRKKWTQEEVAIDPATGMLNYIANRKGDWVTSAAYVENELRAAAALGMTPEGLRFLGNALHTLEDFYSHSNFTELLLLKLGHLQVYPWAHRKVQAPSPRYPLVTGKFGSNDIQVSLAYVLNENLTATKEYVPGQRTASTEILLILLKDIPSEYLDQKQVRRLEVLLGFKEEFVKNHPLMGRMIDELSKLMSKLPNAILSAQARKHATNVTKSQEEFLSNPSFLHPTHSQLSKDHDDHPLHLLAAALAMEVVREIGGLIAGVWTGKGTVETVVREALKYFVHPEDIQNAATDGRSWVFEWARQWARTNPAKLQLLERGAIINRQFTEAKQAEARIRAQGEAYGAPEALLAKVRGTLQGIEGLA
ncbi:HET-C-related protein [Cystobacter fuscus]|uniref:HET-C-related protein n=1 Tax=Cystobacter fuscus TaxID=43 RepID=UPI0002AE5B13|nr:HET-C-related protein [Cystobacter fuscus]